MYTIILQRTNRLINKLFNTDQAFRDKSLLYLDNLLKVIKISFGKNSITKHDIDVEIKDRPYRQDGQFIVVNTGEEVKYIFFSYERPENTRNGYIVSKIPIALREWYNDRATKKTFEVFLLDVNAVDYAKPNYKNVNFCNYSSATVNAYQTFAYKLCRTIGLRILNYDMLPWSENDRSQLNHVESYSPFSSLAELRKMRDSLQRSNTGNKSSYILEDLNKVVIYGKTFGNNGFETILIAATVKYITKKQVYFWQIKDTNTMTGTDRQAAPITQDNLQLLKKLHITVFDELQEYTENENATIKERDARNQIEFMKNLMLKFGSEEKECYLCKCRIQNLIIASHIHRVCDINRENKSFKERRAEAVSADNGLWLCANHDKLFEYGNIYFSDNGQMQIASSLDEDQKQYVSDISSKAENGKIKILPEHLTADMLYYIRLHRNRTHHNVQCAITY